jgi:hypothetical protein
MFSSTTSITCHSKSTNISQKENAIGSSNCNTLNQARKYIHEAFQTAERRQADKSELDKIADAKHIHMPPIAEGVASSMSETLNSGLESVEYKLHHRLSEDIKNHRLQHEKPSSAKEVTASLPMGETMNSKLSPEFLKSVEDLSQVWPNDGTKSNKLGRK